VNIIDHVKNMIYNICSFFVTNYLIVISIAVTFYGSFTKDVQNFIRKFRYYQIHLILKIKHVRFL